MDHMKTMRQPAWGIVSPGATVRVRIDKPIDIDKEAPFLLASIQDSVVIDGVSPDGVTITNKSKKPVGYALVIVPRFAVEVARTPWMKLWRESPLRSLIKSMFQTDKIEEGGDGE